MKQAERPPGTIEEWRELAQGLQRLLEYCSRGHLPPWETINRVAELEERLGL